MLEYLRNQGLKNPHRVKRLIRQTIESLELNLAGLVVVTEAASRYYVVTPIIAAIAGAKGVYAITSGSRYSKAEEVSELTYKFAEFCGVKDNIQVIFEKKREIFSQADIVTNLGFVRPINKDLIGMMKKNAVIPLMCEAWEFRPGDVDLEACRDRGIKVLGTNEYHPAVDVFSYTGWLCLKMLFDAHIEVHKSKIVIVSSDKFGQVIRQRLQCCGAFPSLVPHLRNETEQTKLGNAEALVIADYSRDDLIIGLGGDLSVPDLVRIAPTITVVQFAGRLDVSNLIKHGLAVYPGQEIDAHRMAITLAELGPQPVIKLHTAGLKVGEIGCRGSNQSRRDLTLVQQLN